LADYLVTLTRQQYIDVVVTADSRHEAIANVDEYVEGGQIAYETEWRYEGFCEELDA
jgi:hypothetical protein